jgi:3-oxoacyl-(acyl-carrier-protein) synthase
MSESMIYGGIAAIDAFRDAGLNIPDRDDNFVYEDTGAILGTGVGGITTFAEKVYEKTKTGKVKRLGSTIVEQVMGSSVSAQLGGMLALGNQVTSNSAACSTGTEAVIMGAERIRAGLANRMVVGGTEGSGPWVWGGFDSMRVLARKFNDEPQRASRPMSASACGFVPGSGAGVLVIEDLETAQKRGARIYAEVLGTALNSGGMRNGGSMTAPSPDGVQRCIREAVLKAGIKTTEVDYINGHLTATFADPSEINNWSTALEAAPGRFPKINSTKSMIGHALGAAGALECVATLLQMRDGFVHGSLNCEDLHEKIQPYAEHVVTQSLDRTINVAAKASFGFGDINSCIIFKKMETKS